LVAGLTVRVPAETRKPVMMVQMPLGVMVSEAVDLVVDDGKPEQFNIQTCNQQGCFVGAPLADNLLTAMRIGKQLRIVFKNGNKQAITVTLPLAGFALVYDKVKS
jgi:invasion protein IalB